MRLHYEAIGRLAVNRLVEKMETPRRNRYCLHSNVGVELVVRSSVRDLNRE